jgi:hypothetical protein
MGYCSFQCLQLTEERNVALLWCTDVTASSNSKRQAEARGKQQAANTSSTPPMVLLDGDKRERGTLQQQDAGLIATQPPTAAPVQLMYASNSTNHWYICGSCSVSAADCIAASIHNFSLQRKQE